MLTEAQIALGQLEVWCLLHLMMYKGGHKVNACVLSAPVLPSSYHAVCFVKMSMPPIVINSQLRLLMSIYHRKSKICILRVPNVIFFIYKGLVKPYMLYLRLSGLEQEVYFLTFMERNLLAGNFPPTVSKHIYFSHP